MLANRAKQRLREGKALCGFGITMPSAGVAQALCASGADFLTIDLEHGCIDLAGAHAIVAATGASGCVPIVRVSSARSSAIKPVLDAGALGIVFPMIRSAEELAHGIGAVLYPPAGVRGIGHHFAPARWGVSASSYLQEANDAILKIALIETAEAVHGITGILAVPGLDAATIAPGDLAASLGHPGDPQHPTVQSAVREVESAVLRTGVALGGVASSVADAKRKLKMNYRILVLGFDVGLLQATSSEMVGAIRT